MAVDIFQLESSAEKKYGLPEGILASIRQQETGGEVGYLTDPTKAHYPTGYTASGTKSSAFGPYGILESTARDPGYGTRPLTDKTLASQVDFAASYLTGRSKAAGSLEAGLAGYGEGAKYASQVLNRSGTTNIMATSPASPSNIDSMAAANIDRNDATATALQSFQAQIQQQYGDANNLGQERAKLTETVRTTEFMAAAGAQAASAKAAADLGTDPNAANYALTRIAEQFNKNSDRAQMFADRVANASDISNITKDPLTYIRDLVFLEMNQAGQRSAEAAATRSKDQFIGLNNMTQEVAQTQNAIKQSITTETAKMAGQLASQEIQFDLTKLNIQSLATASDSVAKIAALQNNSMDIALRARDQQLQEQSVQVARQNSALQTRSLNLALEERQERLNLKQEEAQSRETMLAAVNTGRAINGNLPAFKSFNEMQTMAKSNPKLQETISKQYQAGLVAQQTGVASIADSPYEALKYVNGSGAKITDGRSKVINYVDTIRAQLMGNPQTMAGIKKESDLAKALDSAAATQASTMARNVTSGTGNIYAPPPVSALLNDPEFSKTYMAESILAPGAKLGTETINFNTAVGMLVQAAREGIIPMKQVDSELGFMAAKIMGYNNSLYRYKATAGLPDMTTLNVALDDTSNFGNMINSAVADSQAAGNPIGASILGGLLGGSTETIIDLSDPNKRAAYLNKQMVKNIPPVLREQAVINNATKVRGN